MLVEFGVIWSPPLSYQKSFALYFHYRCPPCFEKWDLCDAMPPFDISFVVLYNWITLVLSFSACRHKWHFMCLSLTVQYALHIFFLQMGLESELPLYDLQLLIWVLQTPKINAVLFIFIFAKGFYGFYGRGFCVDNKRHSLCCSL